MSKIDELEKRVVHLETEVELLKLGGQEMTTRKEFEKVDVKNTEEILK